MARGSPLLRNTRVRLKALSYKSYRNIGVAWRWGSHQAGEVRLLGDFIAENSRLTKWTNRVLTHLSNHDLSNAPRPQLQDATL